MPKECSLKSLAWWIKDFPDFQMDGDIIFCVPCKKAIPCKTKNQVISHINNHKKNEKPKAKLKAKEDPPLSPTTSATNDSFKYDLCKSLLTSNIPLQNLDNSSFKQFLEKYCKKCIPEESIMRKVYLEDIYSNVMTEIKESVGTNYFYVIIDETADKAGRYIGSISLGILKTDCKGKQYLITIKELSQSDYLTVSNFISTTLSNFFLPEKVPADKVLLLVSNSSRHMVKAGQYLKTMYKNLIHVTCMLNGLNQVAEEISEQVPALTRFITNFENIFYESPLRLETFKEKLPHLSQPPQVVKCRWDTWMEAALFHAKYHQEVTEIIHEFSETTSLISECRRLLERPQLREQTTFVETNYKFVPKVMSMLQAGIVPLESSIKYLKIFEEYVRRVRGGKGSIIIEKLDEVFINNVGFQSLIAINDINNGETNQIFNLDSELAMYFKYAPVTCMDLKRHSQVYNSHISNPTGFTNENFDKETIVRYYYSSK
ncbi:PREDICTED: uncharacterized protein LOC108569631 isoform X2 [Nicrophorus vespilloides]|uniref:Uncharacterized protein LOC108569631 isoform X2 n=1 Tax=Nicrophorus vespilloides TaxID=110193 RepID=A0ABM1NIU5_NICVS|nr:PREDICTED: uncharacterized protein LOC108569631 isoform X2 [Nicrophorus vespilloides]